MFSDQVVISVKAGKGGNGAVSFRRERFIPKGGPDGGDGGKGGDVFIQSDSHVRTLIQLYRHPHCRAESGENGRGQKKNGKNGQDLWIKVPVGTIVRDVKSDSVLADLFQPGESVRVARGGMGGKGNVRFRSSVHQAPRFAQKGESGEESRIQLILKLIADAGLVGFPNAGKSTLLSFVSAARPKIAPYPFTTIEPYLGVVRVDDENSFVMADIPGLIEGAHRGTGLGTRFLKHIERTKVLVHLIDGSIDQPENLIKHFQIIEDELRQYAPGLPEKEKMIAVNKIDLPEVSKNRKQIEQCFWEKNLEVYFISAISGLGVQALVRQINRMINTVNQREEKIRWQEPEELVHYQYEPEFMIKREGRDFVIQGEKIKKLADQFDLSNPQALEYFQKKIRKLGIEKALIRRGIIEGDQVKIGEKSFYFYS